MAKFHFYYSAMNAGKTTTLLQSAHNYRERGMRPLILAPWLGTRSVQCEPLQPHLPRREQTDAMPTPVTDMPQGVIASRIGISAQARRFSREDDLRANVEGDIARHGPLSCVLVDEAQFLSKAQVWQLSDVVDALGIPVLAYGLRTDFRGELFEGSQYLLAWADTLIEIKTICHTGRKATMVIRVDEEGHVDTEGPQVEIGGNERYVSVSRAEFKRMMSDCRRIERKRPGVPLGDLQEGRR